MGFYIKCPYYIDHKDKSITCEDTVRYYGTKNRTIKMIKNYCEPGTGCKHAKALEELYERTEHMAEQNQELEMLRHQAKCKSAEITKVKKELTNCKNKLEQEKQKSEKALKKVEMQDGATRYIMDAKNREIAKLERKIAEDSLISVQKERSLEMMVGYLAQKYGLDSFRLTDVREFGLKYEVLYSIPDYDDDLIQLNVKEKQNDENKSDGLTEEVPGPSGEQIADENIAKQIPQH